MNRALTVNKLLLILFASLLGCPGPPSTPPEEATATNASTQFNPQAGATQPPAETSTNLPPALPDQANEAGAAAPASMEPAPSNAGAQAAEPASPVSNEANQAQLATQDEVNMMSAEVVPGEQVDMNKGKATVPRVTGQAPVGIDKSAIATLHGAQLTHVTPAARVPQASKLIKQERFTKLTASFKAPPQLSGDTPDGIRLMSLKTGAVAISNLDPTIRVNFAMKSMGEPWRNESLEPEIAREFGCGFPDYCLFWMRTGSLPALYYKMHTPGRYVIFWDNKNTQWDLRVAKAADD